MADRPTEPGRLLAGRYELGALLGSGGMASVFEGTDRVLDRPVAIKVLHARFSEDPRFLERFRREARMAATLAHPGVVAIFDAGTDDHSPYIVMELVEGRTLETLIAQETLPPARAAEIGAAVCEALVAAHAKGLVHRDIKPGNIMLTPEGGVKVMDFGIARAPAHETLTQTAMVMGTAAYLSPEQARGDRVDHRSDLYSLGCVLYAMMTGDPPFTGDNAVAVATRHLTEEAPPVSARRHDVPPALGAIVRRALTKDPADRFADAAAMGTALRGAAEDDATPTRPLPTAAVPLPPTRRRPPSRRWLRAALVLLALAALSGVATYLVLTGGDAPIPAAPDRAQQTDERRETQPGAGSPSPSPTPTEEDVDDLTAALDGLFGVVGEGVAAGEVTPEAQQKIIEGAGRVLEELEKGEVEKSLEEVGKLREESQKLFDDGQITSEERLGAIIAALDELESAIRSSAPPDQAEPGGGPPGGEPPGQEKKEDDE